MKKIDGKRKISWENTLIDKTVKRSISLFSIDTCSVTKSCSTLCDPMDCSAPSFPVLHSPPEFAQTLVH